MTLENNISCLYFHLRSEDARKVVGGGLLVDFYLNLLAALHIVWKFYIQSQITEQSTGMTQSFLCFIVLILFSTLLGQSAGQNHMKRKEKISDILEEIEAHQNNKMDVESKEGIEKHNSERKEQNAVLNI